MRSMLALACALAVSPGGSEAKAQDGSLSGTWRQAGGDSEREQRHSAIDRATDDQGIVVRRRARGQLREITTPAPRLTLLHEGDRVTIQTNDQRMTLQIGRSPTPIPGEGGGTVRANWRNGQLVVSASGENGSMRTTVYHLSDDGQRLTLEVRISSDRLSSPLRYSVTYRRVRAEGG